MLSPLPRHSGWAHYFAHSPSRISLPRYGSRVGLCIVLFEACSAFTRVTACTLAPSPIRDALSEVFSHFGTFLSAPVASAWRVCPARLWCRHRRLITLAPRHGEAAAIALPADIDTTSIRRERSVSPSVGGEFVECEADGLGRSRRQAQLGTVHGDTRTNETREGRK